MKRRAFLALCAALALSACAGKAQTAGSGTAGESASAGSAASPEPTEPEASPAAAEGKSLVIYFSATGNTAKVAQAIISQTGADSFEIVPAEPYTDADLNYSDDSCRANREQNDAGARPEISGSIENFEQYGTIYIGFPIWWGTIPRIINTLLDTYDFGGKTVLPFCTSGGSGISAAAGAIADAELEADVKTGLRLSASAANDCAAEVAAWIEECGV